ncbi:MAG: nucleoside recognition protein [Clostridiaceae bacterium]|nr:nucleoside recognition protein [Clostridiaceae bacterium]
MKKSMFRVISIAVLLLLLWNPALSCRGARNGLVLWADVVLPALMPFMVCSSIIVSLDAIHLLTRPFKLLWHSVFKLSDAGSYVLMSGLLCGYPLGAKNCSEFLDDGRITAKEGKYLLAICNHPSPMFLLGYTVQKLPLGIPLWQFMAAVYLPVFIISWMARPLYGIQEASCGDAGGHENRQSFDESLMNAFEVMTKIGGYIMLFSILVEFVKGMSIDPVIKAMFLGLIEMTTGINAVSVQMKGMVCAVLIIMSVTFGGVSGIFQTKSVIKNAGLSIRHYIFWKLIHSILSCIIFLLLAQLVPVH